MPATPPHQRVGRTGAKPPWTPGQGRFVKDALRTGPRQHRIPRAPIFEYSLAVVKLQSSIDCLCDHDDAHHWPTVTWRVPQGAVTQGDLTFWSSQSMKSRIKYGSASSPRGKVTEMKDTGDSQVEVSSPRAADVAGPRGRRLSRPIRRINYSCHYVCPVHPH